MVSKSSVFSLEEYLLTIRLAIMVLARDSLAVEVIQESDNLEVLVRLQDGLGEVVSSETKHAMLV